MHTVIRLFFLLALAAFTAVAAPVRPALQTTLKGANGAEVAFRVVGIWADGFHIQPTANAAPTFVAWEKVDLEWLATQRADIAKLKAAAKPFPVLTPEQAQARLDAARKAFRAPKEFTYQRTQPDGIIKTNTAANVLGESYARKLRSLTPQNITQGLAQILTDRERDLERLRSAGGVDALQRGWLAGSFTAYLSTLEAAQREIDPLRAGEIVLPTRQPSTSKAQPESDWFN